MDPPSLLALYQALSPWQLPTTSPMNSLRPAVRHDSSLMQELLTRSILACAHTLLPLDPKHDPSLHVKPLKFVQSSRVLPPEQHDPLDAMHAAQQVIPVLSPLRTSSPLRQSTNPLLQNEEVMTESARIRFVLSPTSAESMASITLPKATRVMIIVTNM